MTDTQEYIANLGMPEKVTLFKELYSELAGQGIEGDTELAHVNTFEASLLKSLGGSGTINEVTGLREYKGGGGSPPPAPTSQTVTQTSEFPTELKPFISDVLGEAKGEFGREKAEGYLPFPGPQLAAFTPEQEQAFATGRQQFGAQGLAGTPLAQASTYYAPALAATALGTSEVGTQDIQRRMDPFLQNVVDIAKREARRDEDVAQQRRAAQAVGAGSFGGSRQAIVEAEANRNLQRQLSDIQAAGLSTAFQNAQRAAEAQRAREMTGGRQFAGLGESAFGRAKGDIGGLAGIGEAQQARSQQALDIARREFEEEKAFPSTALQRYGSVIRGFPLTPSQQIVTSAPPIPTPSLAQTMLGAAGTGVGLYGAFGGFKRAGGLVGLLGGGTPMNPLRPPYNLFSGPSSRVGVPQYQGGGPLGVNLGGGYASGAVGGVNTPAPVTSPTAPTAMDLNMIMEELRKRGVRRSEGGLAGLTVSRNARRGRISTEIPRLSRSMGNGEQGMIGGLASYIADLFGGVEVSPEVLEGREQFPPEGTLSPEGPIMYDLDADDEIDETSDFVKAGEAARKAALYSQLTPIQQADVLVEEGAFTGLPDIEEARARGEYARGPFVTDPEESALIKEGFNPVYDPVPEIAPPERPEIIQRPEDFLTGSLIPDVPETQDYSSLESAQDELLAALEAQKKGYGADYWLALADASARFGSTAPREGENLLSVAQRVAPEAIKRISEIKAAERQAGLGFLKAQVDIEGVRATLKTTGEQKRFENIIAKILANAEVKKADAVWLKNKIGDYKTGSLSGTELKNFGQLHLNEIVDTLEQDMSAVAKGMKDYGWTGDSQKAAKYIIEEMKKPESKIYGQLAFRTEEIYENQVGPKDKQAAANQAAAELIFGGGKHVPKKWWKWGKEKIIRKR